MDQGIDVILLFALIALATVVCAVQALRASRLLVSALWLAGCSALVALMLYLLGAHEIAVIELSVGAGLVTILFVFAISVAGDEVMDARGVVPRPLALALVIAAALGLAWMTLNHFAVVPQVTAGNEALTDQLWEQRGLDVLVQIALIFGGVLGVLGLLADAKPHHSEASEEARS